MGDPKKPRKKYSTPGHPWIKERIDKERGIIKVYGLKNKKEIWKSESVLKRFREQAKRLISDVTEQGKKEEKQLLSKLIRLGLVKDGCKIEDILDLGLEDILEKRLQTLLLISFFLFSLSLYSFFKNTNSSSTLSEIASRSLSPHW